MRSIALLLVCVPLMAHAQNDTTARDSLAGQVIFNTQIPHIRGVKSIPRFFPQGYQYVTPRCGVWGIGFGQKNYFSTVAGPFCDVIPKVLELGAAVGGEFLSGTDSTYLRYAGDMLLGDIDKLGVDFYFEYGASRSSWYQMNALWVLSPTVAIGALGQRDDGLGPQVRLKLPGFPVRAGAMYALTPKERGNMLFFGQVVWDWEK